MFRLSWILSEDLGTLSQTLLGEPFEKGSPRPPRKLADGE